MAALKSYDRDPYTAPAPHKRKGSGTHQRFRVPRQQADTLLSKSLGHLGTGHFAIAHNFRMQLNALLSDAINAAEASVR